MQITVNTIYIHAYGADIKSLHYMRGQPLHNIPQHGRFLTSP